MSSSGTLIRELTSELVALEAKEWDLEESVPRIKDVDEDKEQSLFLGHGKDIVVKFSSMLPLRLNFLNLLLEFPIFKNSFKKFFTIDKYYIDL